MTDILDEARKMLEGLPDGPWSAGVLGRTLHMVWAKDGYIVADCATHHAKHRENVARDFIIWSRTGVPALIERVAALEAENKRLRDAARDVIDVATDTYTARNGRRVSIQADDGEKCWIIHSDQIELLRGAIEVLAKGGSDAE